MKHYRTPNAEFVLLAAEDVMKISDENSLFVDVLDGEE